MASCGGVAAAAAFVHNGRLACLHAPTTIAIQTERTITPAFTQPMLKITATHYRLLSNFTPLPVSIPISSIPNMTPRADARPIDLELSSGELEQT